MNRQSIFRAAAVVSSVGLFSGYVLYRGGVLSLPTSAQAQVAPTAEPSTQPSGLISNSGNIAVRAPTTMRTMILGSKSGAVIDPARLPPPQVEPQREERVILPGSKSESVIINGRKVPYGDDHVDWTPATVPSSQPRTVLPGSKSLFPSP